MKGGERKAGRERIEGSGNCEGEGRGGDRKLGADTCSWTFTDVYGRECGSGKGGSRAPLHLPDPW